MEEEQCRIEAIIGKFERELREESDAEWLPKAQYIKKNVKKIEEGKRKLAKEVAK